MTCSTQGTVSLPGISPKQEAPHTTTRASLLLTMYSISPRLATAESDTAIAPTLRMP